MEMGVKMNSKFFITISLLVILAGCSNGATKIGNPSPMPLPEDPSQATKIGNPSPMPLPEDPNGLRDAVTSGASFAKMYLSGHDWQGSSDSGDIYAVKFGDGVATVASVGAESSEDLAYKVNDDGSVISEGEEVVVAGSLDKDSEYPLDLKLMKADGESIKLFAGASSDGWLFDKLNESDECIDTDAILLAQGNSYVKGLVKMDGIEFSDHCEDGGKVLVEYVCTSKAGYTTEKTSCDCQSGRCTFGAAIEAYKAIKEMPVKMHDILKKIKDAGNSAVYFNTKLLGN